MAGGWAAWLLGGRDRSGLDGGCRPAGRRCNRGAYGFFGWRVGRGRGLCAGRFSVFYPERIKYHLEFRCRVTGYFFQPILVAGGVFKAALPLLPDAFGKGHRHMRAEAGGEAQRVFQVVVAALGKINAGQFRVGLFIIGDRRNYARVKRAYGDNVLQRRAHGVAGEAFNVAYHHLVGAGAERFFQRLYFGRSAAAAGRGIGFVRHEHRVRRHLFFLQAVNVLHLGHKLLHHGGHVVGVQAGDVESGVRAIGKEQPGQRLHAAAPGQGFVLYNHAYRAGAYYQAVAAAVERQGRF